MIILTPNKTILSIEKDFTIEVDRVGIFFILTIYSHKYEKELARWCTKKKALFDEMYSRLINAVSVGETIIDLTDFIEENYE